MNPEHILKILEFMFEHGVKSWAELYHYLLLRKHGGSVPQKEIETPWDHDSVIALANEVLNPEPPSPCQS